MKVVAQVKSYEWTKNSDDAIINAGAILANVEIPAGAVVSGVLGIDLLPELTLWKVLKDLKNNALYIKSYKSLGYVKFDLSPIWSGDTELHENVVNIISSNN
jgi:penicillin V acylase-like amidase (Ntn superfamily)